ncbi:MAG: hypothetical protein EPN97_17505 [Alphaproteobacteria bacterium]|nr:MAG: hypothetical protein EPN97_17505 [Alphaproteobacteria bacterium]
MAEPLKDDDLKKGDAAPLEGTLGPQILFALNCAFTCMTLGMCQNLALSMGQALEGPLLKEDLATLGPQLTSAQSAMTNTITGGKMMPSIENSILSGPKMGGMFG